APDRRAHPPDRRGSDHPHRRARHGGRHGPRLGDHGAALRRGARRGHAERDPGQRPGAGGLPEDLMLALRDVHAHYGKSHVLHGVSIDVGPGEVVGLLGRNGVGKSTTLKTIMNLVRASAGSATCPRTAACSLLTVLENLRTGLDRPRMTAERREALLEKVYGHFPVLRER